MNLVDYKKCAIVNFTTTGFREIGNPHYFKKKIRFLKETPHYH